MILRQYQKDLINETRDAFRKHKRPLVVLGCGGGKDMYSWKRRKSMCREKIKKCIRLLKISGENTKAEVLKILEGLLDDKR